MPAQLRRLRLRPRHVLGHRDRLTFALANIGAVVAKPGDHCSTTMPGTYLQSGTSAMFDGGGNPLPDATMGRVISLNVGGSVSIVNKDNTDLTNAPAIRRASPTARAPAAAAPSRSA